MDYKKIYDNLIEKAKEREITGVYYELHHIVPKSLGGSDDESNIVKLTLREHYFAHELLVEIYPGNTSLICALWIMTITTISSYNKQCSGNEKIWKRIRHYVEDEGKKLRISSSIYEKVRQGYIKARRNKKYSIEERKHVSEGTKKAMKNKEIIEKCISGSKGCKFYHNIETKEVKKWFPGDDEIDLTVYAWGRSKMLEEQKKKISESNKLNKRYFIVPQTKSKYSVYTDYIKSIPEEWEEKWTNESNRKLKQYITEAVREFNISSEFKYEGQIIFKVPNKSKNFNIITPSLYVCCGESMANWRTENIVHSLAVSIEENINDIIEMNKKYINIKN